MRGNARPMPVGLEVLLVLWVATLPTDRVDLLGGMAGFILTPYLALTPLVLLLLGFRMLARRDDLEFPANARPFAVSLLALVSVLLVSSLLALDPALSLRRVVHFLAVSGGASVVALVLVSEERAGRVLARGAELGLALMLVFAVLGIVALLFSDTFLLRIGPATLSLEPSTYGGIIPRFTGSVVDPNRTGMAVLFFLFCLAEFGRPGLRRRIWLGAGVLMALLTLSRSTLGAGAGLLVTAWMLRGSLRITRGQLGSALVALVIGAGGLLALPEINEAVWESLEPLGDRFSLSERSTQDHFHLMARGVEEHTATLKRAVIGIGYGNAHLTLQDMFPGNKYGNFHSAYVTLLVEGGVFAFLIFLLILAYPLVRPGPFTPMVVALVAFNLFYQAFNGPVLWLVCMLAWTARGATTIRPRDPGQDLHPTPQP